MKSVRVNTAVFALAGLLWAEPATAQEPVTGDGTLQVGSATIAVGGGSAILTLPEIASMMIHLPAGGPIDQTFRLSDDLDDEIGWNVNGSVSVPIGRTKTLSLSGFSAQIEQTHSETCFAPTGTEVCQIAPIIDTAAGQFQSSGSDGSFTQTSTATRDVHQWGGALELQHTLTPSVMGVTRAGQRRYLAFGADVRGIDQDLDVDFTASRPNGYLVTYDEELDTTYYGAFLAWGGDVPRLLFGGLRDKLGLRSTFRLQGGVYHAETDYNGEMLQVGPQIGGDPTSALALSDSETAFIGGLALETSKRIGRRASLSLKSDYEYYSYVPTMAYNQQDFSAFFNATQGLGGQAGTVINDDDAFALRTSLRLTIGLGPGELYR